MDLGIVLVPTVLQHAGLERDRPRGRHDRVGGPVEEEERRATPRDDVGARPLRAEPAGIAREPEEALARPGERRDDVSARDAAAGGEELAVVRPGRAREERSVRLADLVDPLPV